MELNLIEKSEFDRIRENAKVDPEYLSLYSDMCRFNCYAAIKKAGSGHLGSSFSAMDIVCYLYLRELNTIETGLDSPDRDIYFSSKGHDVPGLYSLFYSLGLTNETKLMKLRRFDGLDGHPDVSIPGIESNTGSLGMGISKGKGMSIAKKLQGNQGRIFVLTSDGEFQEGQIYESMQTTSHQKINNLTVIIDKNKFQTDRMVNNVNKIDDLTEKVKSFGWYVDSFDGHDFDSISNAIEKSKEIQDQPKFLIADTIKGKGISFLESEHKIINGEIFYKWHSGAPDDEHFQKGCSELYNRIVNKSIELGIEPIRFKFIENLNQTTSKEVKEYITDAFGEHLVEIAEKRNDIIVIDGDLSADCKLRKFEYRFPERFIENGIAEQDMVSTAGGLARMGMLPIVSSFASFLTSRANEQIYNNACEHTKIIYACHFSGLIPAGPGKSHQSVRDISLLSAIPNITIIQPANKMEMIKAVDWAVYNAKENVALRMVIGPSPRNIQFNEDFDLKVGRGNIIRNGIDSVLFAYGPVMLHEALLASEILENEGNSLRVVNMPWLNRIDNNWFNDIIKDVQQIFTLDDHSIYGGLGDLIINAVNQSDFCNDKAVTKFGLDEYPACGTPNEVLGYHKLDGKSIAERILNKSIYYEHSTKYSVEAPQ